MKVWIDDVRPAPNGYVWKATVNDARKFIEYCENIVNHTESITEQDKNIIETYTIELIDIDHDAGDYVSDGGDYIKLLDWLEETRRNYPIRIHSMNPVGIANMRKIIQRNNWIEMR